MKWSVRWTLVVWRGSVCDSPHERVVKELLNIAVLLHIGVLLIAMASSVTAQPPAGRFEGRGEAGRGGRGGFDPSNYLDRFDRNQNGKIDPEEVDRRSRAFLQRFVPGVDLSRPVAIDELKQRIQLMRGGDGRPAATSSRGAGGSLNQDEIEPLVPGFDEAGEVVTPVPGFGSLAEFFNVKVVDADLAETQEAFRRYDRDGNGLLDAREMRRGRWFDDPTAYDQNRDGQLSERELSIRYARRRLNEAKSGPSRESEEESRADNPRAEPPNATEQRKSYRFKTAHERLPEGLPAWFRERDQDLDGQVSMAEFFSAQNPDSATEFEKLDRNRDGLIVADELLDDTSATSSMSAGDGAEQESSKEANDETLDRYLRYATSIVKKYDTDGDGKLSRDEMSRMRRRPEGADENGDGKISPQEYARHLMQG